MGADEKADELVFIDAADPFVNAATLLAEVGRSAKENGDASRLAFHLDSKGIVLVTLGVKDRLPGSLFADNPARELFAGIGGRFLWSYVRLVRPPLACPGACYIGRSGYIKLRQ